MVQMFRKTLLWAVMLVFCFILFPNSALSVAGLEPINPVAPIAQGKEYLLTLSWQPTFCEGKPKTPECEELAKNPDRPEATHFVLHGLWPQPEYNVYCGVSKSNIALDEGVSKDWSKLPPIEKKLSPETWKKLQAVMPGTKSYLHRHEWIKHGTCYPGNAEEYFSESIALLDAFNNSPVQKLVANHIGKQVALKDVDQALTSFGPSTGKKTQVKCTKSLLSELWVNLKGDITLTTPVSDLLKNAPPAQPEKDVSCVIDDARD